MSNAPRIHWTEGGQTCSARWQSEAGVAPPKKVAIVDDTTTADEAYHLACEGSSLLWRGDFQNARQLLQAMARRIEQKPRRAKRGSAAAKAATKTDGGKPAAQGATHGELGASAAANGADAFNRHRLAQSQRARTLGALLLPLEADYSIALRRAPNVPAACLEAYGPAVDAEPAVVSLRELLGVIGAHEWRKKGVEVPATGGRIHPYYGVFSPVRGEYVDLVARAPLPATTLAFDIGTGTGVLSAVLAKRGVERILATDTDARARACASENLQRLGFGHRVDIIEADLFPEGQAPLIVCNPPWVPARPASPVEAAVFDPDSRMLLGFLRGLADHLTPDGEGWLILSDFAEHLGLRTRDALLAAIAAGGLAVVDRMDVRPVHPRANDQSDPLHAARSREVTSLWRLRRLPV